jgi:hypothetical protein
MAALGMNHDSMLLVTTGFTSLALALDGPSVSRHSLVEYNAFLGLLLW